MQMILLNTKIIRNEVAKHNKADKWGSYAQEQGQITLLSTRTSTNEVAKHNNKAKWYS